MRVVVLIDNNPDPDGKYLTEHGVSVYFEADGLKWLFDVGASPAFAINAKKLGIDIRKVDYLILSHAHRDHTGGLDYFLLKNKKARIVMAPLKSGELFISYRKNIYHNITLDHSVIRNHSDRFDFAISDQQLSSNVILIRYIPVIVPLPKANCLLFQSDEFGERPDDFNHEIALTVRTPKGIVVFSGCSHHGLLNILRAATQSTKDEKVVAIIGGTHLLDSDNYIQFETTEEITGMAESISIRYPEVKILTGHCTGVGAQQIFRESLNDRFQLFHSGAAYDFA
jgi:7,8-dihydropterin-6-yl-methyl-4-(beta-D-ribofuranosyl)aminobenzene 5'-phosphate synthase